jgi:hypothetical protein
MSNVPWSKEYQSLQERLRILILQHRSEAMDYDEAFLREVRLITGRLLHLKSLLKESARSETFIFPFEKQKTGRLERYF